MSRIFYLLISVTFISCSDFKTGNGGLLYKIVEDKSGPEIGEVAFVSISYTEASESGKVLSHSGKFDERPAMIFARMPEFQGDFQDALQYLSEGDSAIFKVSMDSIRKKRNYHPLNDTSRYMIYHVRVHKVINRNGVGDSIYPRKIRDFQRLQYSRLKLSEPNKIKTYLAQSKTTYRASPEGLFFAENLAKSNNVGKVLKVNYVLSSLDGKVYETNNQSLAVNSGVFTPSQSYEPLRVSSDSAPFPGFGEAIKRIPLGVKTSVIIPSSLAYGRFGSNRNIPAYCPLLCEFEILNK